MIDQIGRWTSVQAWMIRKMQNDSPYTASCADAVCHATLRDEHRASAQEAIASQDAR